MKKLLQQYLIKFKDNKLGVDEIRDLKFAQEITRFMAKYFV